MLANHAPTWRHPRRLAGRIAFTPLALIALLVAGAAALPVLEPPAAAAHDTSGEFVTRSGSDLLLAGQPYTFTGINLYNANSDGWCRDELDDTDFQNALAAAGLGGENHGVLRAWFFQTLATDKDTRTRDWTRFDRTIAIAKAQGYKVIATLTDQWGECGTDVTPTYGFKSEDWYTSGYLSPDPGMVDDGFGGGYGAGWLSYRDWVAEVVARYENEPAILAWQLINEAEVNPGGAFGVCTPGNGPRDKLISWASDMSGLVQSLDTNHLISLGTIGGGQCGSQGSQYQDVHALPNIDVCEVHDYTPNQAIPGDPWNGFGVRVDQCAALDKPLIVGETGIVPNTVGGTLEDRALAFRAKRLAQLGLGVDGIVAWNFYPGGSTLDNFDIGPGDPMLTELASAGPALVVNTADDSDDFSCDASHCSLREAIQASNAQLGTDLIAFDIPGGGVHTIAPTSGLPDITDALLIDGTTQPVTAGSPLVAIDGTGAGAGTVGIRVMADDVTIRGLRVTAFDGAGIETWAERTRVDGSTIDHNGGDGVTVTNWPYDATITGNRILENGRLGIDLGADGPSFSDPQAPGLSTVSASSDEVWGALYADPGIYRIELFELATCDPSGYGEGDTPVASLEVEVMPGFPSYANFTFQPSGGVDFGDRFAATATGPDGATSEFSNCATTPLPNLSLALDDEAELVGEGEPVRYTLTVENATQVYANDIVLEHTLPAGATFGAAVPSQGTCGEAAGVVTCELGSLVSFGFGPGVITVTVDVRLGSAGVASTSATVTAAEPETNQLDNAANDTTTVAVATPATYTVTSSNDANDGTCSVGHCSLREAVLAANANPGRDTILFSLGGPATIQPASPGLPVLTGPVVIDATTNAGWAVGQPNVVLSGASAFGWYGLRVAAGDSEIRGLILNGWYNPAIQLERWGDDVVAGNWLGLDAAGTTKIANSSQGINATTWGNRIGGTTPADRNVISGSNGTNVRIGRVFAGAPDAHDNVVQGNWIGLNAAGTDALPSVGGIVITSADDNVIGGTTPGAGNVIAGGTQTGIQISDDGTGPVSERNLIQGNVIGLTASGSGAPNYVGVRLSNGAHQTTIGGAAPGAGNTISGNTLYGIEIFNGPNGTIVQGNRIGTSPDGSLAVPNGQHGVHTFGSAPNTLVGGTAPGAGNTIAFNVQDGLFLEAGIAILGNSIHSNGGLGIDRTPNGITATPAALAFPVVTSAVTQVGTTTVTGTLTAGPNATYRIELFGSSACDPSGNGEGQAFLAAASVTTNGVGTASFSVGLPAHLPDGTFVTATSTTSNGVGQTSEFSACRVSGPETTSGSGATGSTTTTDAEADGATPLDPIETSVTVPATVVTGAPITIAEQSISGTPPAGYGFFGQEIVITAPVATVANPLVLVFTLDASGIPVGQDANTVVLFRNGVPVAACTAADASATPDPCVFLRETLAAAPHNGDIRLTVRTSQASTWNVGVTTVTPDTTDPVITFVERTPATNGWNNGDVTVTWSCTDSGSGVVADTVTQTVTTEGASQSATGTCVDNAGNDASNEQTGINIDKTAPVLTCPTGGPFLLGSGNQAVGPAGVDAGISGLDGAASTLTGVVSTASVGPKVVTFSARDMAGNASSRSCSYDVVYAFSGFLQPVDILPTVNLANAGRAIPVKFSLGGNQGLSIFAAGSPSSQKVACDTSAPLDAIEQTVTAASSDLTYDAATGTYTYVWKTSKSWKGSCRHLIVTLADGSTHVAAFRLD